MKPDNALLPREAILEYQEIYKKEFGQEISYDDAREQGTKLLRLFGLIYRPIPKSWLVQPQNKNNKRRKERSNEAGKYR